jgi:crotonobetainyl-CoA:carnitine CoA-transferase CaiB-like acyl-CoA transferase
MGGSSTGAGGLCEPLIAIEKAGAASSGWRPTAARPLAGVKVLDLTRVLAGPVATRFLAGYGADVLRIDPLDWDERAIEPEVTLGKCCARLDLSQSQDRARFERLISEADLFIHGYRPEALGALGYGEDIRRALNPSIIDVRLDAYGWSGPWRNRRGFDSLVQMSTGIAAAGRAWRGTDKPVPLPVQALDHATGYLMAAAAIRGLALRLSEGEAISAGLSLARTAALLMGTPRQGIEPKALSPAEMDYSAGIEATDWGSARRALPPVKLAGAPIGWSRPASRLGSAPAAWGA